jgi:hypothetical protein
MRRSQQRNESVSRAREIPHVLSPAQLRMRLQQAGKLGACRAAERSFLGVVETGLQQKQPVAIHERTH